MLQVRQPYPPDVTITASTSLDHTIHFHREFRADDWLLFHNETAVSSGGRGVARTEVFTGTGNEPWGPGVLVASIMQEGMVRPPRSWEPEEGQEAQLDQISERTTDLIMRPVVDRAKL